MDEKFNFTIISRIRKVNKMNLSLLSLPNLLIYRTGDVLCPFIRIIYMMSVEKEGLLRDLLERVIEVNAIAFKFHNLPVELYEAALTTYELTKSQVSVYDITLRNDRPL